MKSALYYDAVVAGGGPAGALAAYTCVSGGATTAIVEKKKLPRHKACSGILVPRSVNIITREFDKIPDHVLSDPGEVKAMRMHFKSGRKLDLPLQGRSVKRHLFDQWLCNVSGAEILDGTTLVSFSEETREVELVCRKEQEIKIRCRVFIAADGGDSNIAKRIDPARHRSLSWYLALQEVYDCRSDLEPGVFHFFAIPEISPYASAYIKDGQFVSEVVARQGQNIHTHMAGLIEFLKKNMDAGNSKLVRRIGCRVTYAAARGSYCFGTPRILVAGEASGLLNPFGEGISSALASGLIAGEAAITGIKENFAPGVLYHREIEAEKTLTSRQFKTATLMFGAVPTFGWKSALFLLPWEERVLLLKDLISWYLRLRAGEKT
jgi:flavin-dependent dehydrogenase